MLMHHFLEICANRLGDKTALVSRNQRLSYLEIYQKAHQLANFLAEIGVRRQDRVVIFLDNSAESVIALFGILKAGCAFVMLNGGMKAPKLNYILKDSGASAMISHVGKRRLVREAMAGASCLKHFIWCGDQQQDGDGVPDDPDENSGIQTSTPWSQLFESASMLSNGSLPHTIDLDLAAIIYTSGSTGDPKGVVSAHYNMVSAASSIIRYLKNTENDIILNALPLSFDYGLYQVLMAVIFGGTVILESSFVFPYRIMESLVQEKVTGFPIVPTMAAILLKMEQLARFDFGTLRYITNTGAALPVTHIRKMQEIFPHVDIYSMYGLTECKRVSYLPPEQLSRRPESVGVAMPNSEAFVVDSQGRSLGPHEVGELVVRGSNVMLGYWNAPEETARVFRPGQHRREALLYTGDLFRTDEEGYLYFVARKDDLIKTKGERVSPKAVENILCAFNGIVEAAVIGVPDPVLGQAIKAFIVRNERQVFSEKDILAHCTGNLEPFAVPKYLEFRKTLPKSPSGKIDKKHLAKPD